ncbi:hypothetical protein D1007_55408 [Hordeum vulgare]|nr:hypothetical protein D1007_55408 [Hordeum vulgare]
MHQNHLHADNQYLLSALNVDPVPADVQATDAKSKDRPALLLPPQGAAVSPPPTLILPVLDLAEAMRQPQEEGPASTTTTTMLLPHPGGGTAWAQWLERVERGQLHAGRRQARRSCEAALREFTHQMFDGMPNSRDEYHRLYESSCLKAMLRFATAMVNVFGSEYLREPNVEDIAKLVALSKSRGWACVVGSLDCKH